MYIDHIHLTHKLLPLAPHRPALLPLHYHPTLYPIIPMHITPGYRAIHWKMINLQGATAFKKLTLHLQEEPTINSSSARSCEPFPTAPHPPLHASMLSSLTLCRSYAGSHSCCEFLSTGILSCPNGRSYSGPSWPLFWLGQPFHPLCLRVIEFWGWGMLCVSSLLFLSRFSELSIALTKYLRKTNLKEEKILFMVSWVLVYDFLVQLLWACAK